jgi:hypothetical protein
MKTIFKKILRFINMVLIYLFLVIDRLILVPFPMIESKSVFSIAEQNDEKLAYSIIRVMLALIVACIVILLKLIF